MAKTAMVTTDMNRSNLEANLQKYREKAVEFGADDAKIVSTRDIPVEEAVTVKCRIPRCFGYGTSANCPPHAPKPAEMKAYLEEYERAVLFARFFPTELLLRDRGDKEKREAFRSIYEIGGKIESMAFSDGHYLAFGLAAGSCRTTLCGIDRTCAALEGEVCRFYMMARPSMEAVGINVYKMVADAGWSIYPVGRSTSPEDVPQATLAGIVIIR